MSATHSHHQFGEEVPCDLPDTYEAHYGPRMTLATCPTCGTCPTIFVRSPQGLVCLTCR